MIINRKNIVNLIPQRTPFIMVHELLEHSDTITKSSFSIEEDNLLLENGVLSHHGLIENIAQTAAAGMGYWAKQSGERPKIGFIGSVSKFRMNMKPRIGDKLSTTVTKIAEFGSVQLVKGSVSLGDKEIAFCELKIATSEES